MLLSFVDLLHNLLAVIQTVNFDEKDQGIFFYFFR
jgi:hypothetical protein